MSLLQEYRNSLKMAEAEEILDLIFYRPIAFVFVKLIYRLPITPNQVTLLSFFSGLLSAWYFCGGTEAAYVAAGTWYAVANMLDCGDGMLARLQNSGSPFGRLVDGVVDWAVSLAIFSGAAIGLTVQTGNAAYWWLAVAGGLASALHAFVFDYYQQEYISNVRGRRNFLSQELARVEEELQALVQSRKSAWKQTALRVYLSYMGLQSKSQFKEDLKEQAPPEVFRRHNYRIMQWWTLLGPTTNRTGLIVAAFFGRPDLFFWIVLIPGNLYLLGMLLWQHRVQRRLDAELRSSSPLTKQANA